MIDAHDDGKTWAHRREAYQAYGNEPERKRFQMPAIRITDGSHCVFLVIQRTSSWSIYGADEDGVHVSDVSMTILARLILKSNDADSTA